MPTADAPSAGSPPMAEGQDASLPFRPCAGAREKPPSTNPGSAATIFFTIVKNFGTRASWGRASILPSIQTSCQPALEHERRHAPRDTACASVFEARRLAKTHNRPFSLVNTALRCPSDSIVLTADGPSAGSPPMAEEQDLSLPFRPCAGTGERRPSSNPGGAQRQFFSRS